MCSCLNKTITKGNNKILRNWLHAYRMHKTLYQALSQTQDVELLSRLLILQVTKEKVAGKIVK
jgi:hypothetical protein